MPDTVWTIGHSTHAIDRFLALLRTHGIQRLADVRRFPTSRWPQFRQEDLRASLEAAGIDYVHLKELGGFRTGGYEVHIGTQEFTAGIDRLALLASEKPTAIMCAEAVFFRCHRRHVSDALLERGYAVVHIYPDGRTHAHEPRASLDAYAGETAGSGSWTAGTARPRIAKR